MTGILAESKSVSEIDQLAVKSRELVEHIRETLDPEDVRSKHAQAKAVRKYMEELKQVHEIRQYLLPVEIACIVKAAKLGAKLPGVSKGMASFFLENGDDPSWYWSEYPECETARHIWDAQKYRERVDGAHQDGKDQARGFMKYMPVPRDGGQEANGASHENVSSAVAALIEEYAWGGHSFSISDMAQKALQTISVSSDAAEIHQSHMEGVKEVCRHAVLRERVDTVSGLQAPRFVTCYDDVWSDGVEKHWVRIPFENASLSHLSQMIALRENQIQQDIKALQNLKSLHETLFGISSGPDDERSLGELASVLSGGIDQ